MTNNDMSRNRKKSSSEKSSDKKINLRSWKKTWQAETATPEEARSLRKRLVKRWRKGDDLERKTARIVGQCIKGEWCGSPKCPVCERLRRRKARRNDVTQAPPQQVQHAAPAVILTRASEITPQSVPWIWRGIASGKVTGIVGHPGLGKSQVAVDIAATISTGRPWPGGAANASCGDVIFLAAEDDPADTLSPRLMAAGADCSRVHLVGAVKEASGAERAFNLARDLDQFANGRDMSQVKLLVIDPVSAYMTSDKGSRVSQNSGGDVRAIQTRLAAFAVKNDLAVLTVSHLNKTGGTKAINRITGSLEWVAAVRAMFLVTEEPKTGWRLLLPVKNNLAQDSIGYAFRIEEKVVADGMPTSAVVWRDDPVTMTADEALRATATMRPA
jgi:putative DNA primase/helicase